MSFQDMLQLLDGIGANGMAVIMTTNHIERIDPAVIRSGRVELKEEFRKLDEPLVRTMCERFDVDASEMGFKYPCLLYTSDAADD